MANSVQKRELWVMALLMLVTFGFYFIYWAVTTKRELYRLGADIPTAWLLIIPIAHFYFWYRYADAFTTYIKKGADPIGYFLLMALMPIVGIFVIQYELNKHAV